MKVTPSAVPGIALLAREDPEFIAALAQAEFAVTLDRLEPALPFSVIVANRTLDPVALFGVRFDMLDAKAKPCCVVHYADTLRNPEKAGLPAGASRFVCAEATFTTLAVGGNGADGRETAQARTRLNIGNLRKMLQIRVSLDCVAFADGRFAGPDSLGAFARLNTERAAEMQFMDDVLQCAGRPASAMEAIMKSATSGDRIHKNQARRLLEAFAGGGFEAMMAKARAYRPRIELHR
jgi:hypothetical protein